MEITKLREVDTGQEERKGSQPQESQRSLSPCQPQDMQGAKMMKKKQKKKAFGEQEEEKQSSK